MKRCLECQNNPSYISQNDDGSPTSCRSCGGYAPIVVSEFEVILKYIYEMAIYPNDLKHKFTPEKFLESLYSKNFFIVNKKG